MLTRSRPARAWRRGVIAVAGVLGLVALVAVPRVVAVDSAAGPVVAQPVLGPADLEMTLMGSASPENGADTWAYRVLPASVPPPRVGGHPLEFGDPGDPASPDDQLAFLRHTAAQGWHYAETAVDESGRPYRFAIPNRHAARVTAAGGGVLLGRDPRRPAGRQAVVLVRNPESRFAVVPGPPEGVLSAGEALAEDDGTGRVAMDAYDADGRTAAFFGALGPEVEQAVARFDGQGWSREPLEPAGASGSSAPLEIVAIAAGAGGRAWLLARAPASAGRGLILFERVASGGARWVERHLGGTFFEHYATPSLGIEELAPLGGSAQPLTAAGEGVWIDGAIVSSSDSAAHSFTVYFDPGTAGGTLTGSWCDAVDPDGDRICEQAFGARLSTRIGYRSFAWPGEGFGTRVITNALEPGGDDGTNRGTYLRLDGEGFLRMPGGGGNFRGSGAFSTADEGWLPGPTHITRNPEPQSLQDSWPLSARAPLVGAAPEPGRPVGDLGAQALAVGPDGTVLRHHPGGGWGREFLLSGSGSVVKSALRSVAWPESARAHAVGDLGAMWLWRRETGLWERDPAAPIGFEGNLMGVAFDPSDPERGYAVGKDGVLLGYGKTWEQEPVPASVAGADLTQIAFAGSQAIVAAGPALLVNDGGGWRVDSGAADLLDSVPGEQELFAVAGLPDGGAVAAGRDVVLVRDGATAPWRFADQPLVGSTVVAAAAVREGARVRAVVAASPLQSGQRYPPADDPPITDPNEPPPILPPFPLPADGYVLTETASGWRDEQHTSFRGSGEDRPVKSDPVLAFLLSPQGTGWALGGWSGEADSAGRGSSGRNAKGRADRARVQTAAAFRYGDGGAAPPGAAAAGLPMPQGPVRMAVAGHGQCERPCADLSLQGIRPDRALQAVLAKTAALRAQAGGPRLMLYTGGRLANGTDAALAPREHTRYAEVLLRSAAVPVFPAFSASDLAAGTGSYTSAFAGASAPFGGGPAAPGIQTAGIPGATATGGRTHYAFDSFGAEGALRVVVIDNSAGSLEASDPHQNPPEPQRPWLSAVLEDARAKGIAAVVMGSRDLNTRFSPRLNAASDGELTARQLIDGGASAYFFERPEEARVYRLSAGGADTIPSFGTGTLGYRSPVSDPSSSVKADALFGDAGFLMAEVDIRRRDPLTNRAPVAVRTIPLIEDISLQPLDGTLLRRSRPALFQGLGRRPTAGDRWGDPSSADGNANPAGADPYLALPPVPCLVAGCSTRLQPEYEFLSSDPDLGDFVRQDPSSTNLRKPLLGTDDKPISDSQSGLFCAFNAGVTTVTVRAGGLSYSQQVRILPGTVQRPCGTRPLRPDRFRRAGAAATPPPPPAAPQGGNEPPVSFDPPPPPPAGQAPPAATVAAKAAIPLAPFVPLGEPLAFLPPTPLPVPAPVLRPSPPSGGFGRAFEKEREEEVAPEEMQAASRFHHEDQGFPTGHLLGALVLAALAGATIFGGPRSRERVQAAPAYASRTHDHRRKP